jgi:tRNA-specific 2-thiouridylase
MRLVEPDVAEGHDAAIETAREVCEVIGLRHKVVDLRAEFEAHVIARARALAAAGATPNPCVMCNESVKFGALLERAITNWADTLATGHYVRVDTDDAGVRRIARPVDVEKDQTYFLYRVAPDALGYLEFPLADARKVDVLEEAAARGLPLLDRESQDVCVPRAFELDPGPAGRILDADGTVLGNHDDVRAFTVGQRKGLGLAGGPYYVTHVDAHGGDVRVDPKDALSKRHVCAVDPVWTHPDTDAECLAQVRYRSTPTPAHATLRDGELVVEFHGSVDAPAPGQAVVCYVDDVVIGGGVIAESW